VRIGLTNEKREREGKKEKKEIKILRGSGGV
jgi:hypothetical protein